MQHPGRSCFFQSQYTEDHFWFGNQKVLDMKNGLSRNFVFLAPETYVILRDRLSSCQINFFKKWI